MYNFISLVLHDFLFRIIWVTFNKYTRKIIDVTHSFFSSPLEISHGVRVEGSDISDIRFVRGGLKNYVSFVTVMGRLKSAKFSISWTAPNFCLNYSPESCMFSISSGGRISTSHCTLAVPHVLAEWLLNLWNCIMDWACIIRPWSSRNHRRQTLTVITCRCSRQLTL